MTRHYMHFHASVSLVRMSKKVPRGNQMMTGACYSKKCTNGTGVDRKVYEIINLQCRLLHNWEPNSNLAGTMELRRDAMVEDEPCRKIAATTFILHHCEAVFERSQVPELVHASISALISTACFKSVE